MSVPGVAGKEALAGYDSRFLVDRAIAEVLGITRVYRVFASFS